MLGQLDLLAAELRQRQVGDLEVGLRDGRGHALSKSRVLKPASSNGGQQPLVLVLLKSQPVLGVDVLGPLRLGRKPARDRVAQLRVALDPGREGDVRQTNLKPRQQLLQRPQPLQLAAP